MASRANLLLVVGYLAALGLGAYELRRGPDLSVPPAPSEQPAPVLPPLEVLPDVINSLAAYDTIVERPLFSADRRPELAETASVQTNDSLPEEGLVEIDGFRLTAVLRDADQTTVLIEDRTGKNLKLQAGERLGNWRLDEIQDDRVVLTADGRRETLMVYDFSRPTTAPPPARRPTRRLTQRPGQRPVPPARRVRPQQPNQE